MWADAFLGAAWFGWEVVYERVFVGVCMAWLGCRKWDVKRTGWLGALYLDGRMFRTGYYIMDYVR